MPALYYHTKLPNTQSVDRQYFRKNDSEPDDSDWTVIPVTNFDAYFGSTMFSRKWLYRMPESLFVKDKANCGICRGRAVI